MLFLIAEPMLGPLGNVQIRPWACHDSLPFLTVEGKTSLKDIERFLFARLNMRRRATSRRHDGFYEEILTVRIATGRQIPILIPRSENHSCRVGGVNYPDTSIRHIDNRSSWTQVCMQHIPILEHMVK